MNQKPNNKKVRAALAMACLALATCGQAIAQTSGSGSHGNMADMPGMNMPSGQEKDQSTENKAERKASPADSKAADEQPMGGMQGMNHGSMPGRQGNAQGKGTMQGMKMGPMQGGSPPPDARDPDAYAEGTRMQSLRGMEMADNERFGRLLANELEYSDSRRGHGYSTDAEAWYGDDYNRIWLKADGERRNGRLGGLRTEALWDRVFATYWSTQLGLRHDTGNGAARNWLAFGVQGLAPYWFETEATAYWGNGGTLAARLEVRYEMLFTQRLILEPKLEANFYSKTDAARGIGAGLSDAKLGLRLRYEIRRQFAPYIGVSWRRKFGNAAEFARNAGEDVRNTEVVAGIRIWF